METFSALLALCAGNSPVTGEFPKQRPMTRSFDVFFDLRLNKRLSKHSWGWWFETPSCPIWRHCNVKWSTMSSPVRASRYWDFRFRFSNALEHERNGHNFDIFKCIFYRKYLCFDTNSTEVNSWKSNCQWVGIDSCDALVPNRRQAFTWTNIDQYV